MHHSQETPLVAIWVVTYNHENFIGKALQSIVSQKTKFRFKAFVGEDCSTDGTRKICMDFQQKYPDLITLIPTKENNLKQNSYNVYNACYQSGATYVALLEGDDYWDDEYKLQKQVDLIEANPSMTAVCHNVKSLKNSTGEVAIRFSENDRPSEKITLQDMLVRNWASTPSVLVKTEILRSTPGWVFSEKAPDFFLWCYAASKGCIGYLHEPMAVYRVNDQGIWSKYSMKDRIFLEVHNLKRAAQMFCTDARARKKRIEELDLYLITNLRRNRLPNEAQRVGRNLMLRSFFTLNFNYLSRVKAGLKEHVEINLY